MEVEETSAVAEKVNMGYKDVLVWNIIPKYKPARLSICQTQPKLLQIVRQQCCIPLQTSRTYTDRQRAISARKGI